MNIKKIVQARRQGSRAPSTPRQYQREITTQLSVAMCRKKAHTLLSNTRDHKPNRCRATQEAPAEPQDTSPPQKDLEPQLYLKTRWRLFLPETPCQPRKRERRKKEGQAIVEFALIAPILLALMLTFLSLWPVLNAGDAVAVAAAAGSHEAAITGGNSESTKQRIQENLQAAGLGITKGPVIELSCDPCPRYQPVTVSIFVPVKPWISLPWLQDEYVVEATVTRASEIDGGSLDNDGGIRLPGGTPGNPGYPGLPGQSNAWTVPGSNP